MSNIELLALVASIASLILAVGAIWLSIVFYKMSDSASKVTTKAASDIDASVQKLEKLFDKLYSDTFSMVKDTVSDMRKHIWSGEDSINQKGDNKNNILEEAERKAEEKVQNIKSVFDTKLTEILRKQEIADNKVSGLSNELESLLENAIQTSSMVESEAREETLQNNILNVIRMLKEKKGRVFADAIVQQLNGFISEIDIIRELRVMHAAGLIEFNGELQPETTIRISKETLF